MFFAFHFGSCFWVGVFLYFIEFESINPPNALYFLGKTSSCLTSPFLNIFENSMISCSLLASFCHHVSSYSVTEFWMICWMVFWMHFMNFDSKMGLPFCFFLVYFPILCRPCFARVSLKVPWLILDPFWFHFRCFEYLFGQLWHRKPSLAAPESVKPL